MDPISGVKRELENTEQPSGLPLQADANETAIKSEPNTTSGAAANGNDANEQSSDEGDDAGQDFLDEDKTANISEKLYRVRSYLQMLEGHPFVSFSDLAENTGVDLTFSEEVLERLQASERIIVDLPNEKLKFEPRADIFDVASLINALERFPDGIPMNEIIDSGPKGIKDIIESAVVAGLVIAIRNRQTINNASPVVLFPRGPIFLTKLSAPVTTDAQGRKCVTAGDVTMDVRRGDALVLGRDGIDALDAGDWTKAIAYSARVSLEASGTEDASVKGVFEQMQRLPPPLTPFSRSSHQDPIPPKGTEFKRVLDATKLPITPTFTDSPGLQNVEIFKHGCTNDIRSLWRKVCKQHAYRPGDVALVNRMLLSNHLTSQEWIAKGGVSGVKKRAVVKKARRVTNRVMKRTNAHLDP
mmetsp:Transcript_23940/g.44441  ORF Transcript_23940/g.44441 Transcript_23940/m.44441 type:complete len:414 (+) Transcript_23940:24-1265(+)